MTTSTAMVQEISIHAPREGGDYVFTASNKNAAISIHAPREGGDFLEYILSDAYAVFQSTPPARGATYNDGRLEKLVNEFQSTPPARGATRYGDP